MICTGRLITTQNLNMDQFFKIGNKNRPVRFGYGAIYQYEKKTGQSVLALLDEISSGQIRLSAIIDLTFAGLINGAKSNNIRVEFDADTVAQWFDEVDQQFIEQLIMFFASSFPRTSAFSENGHAAPEGGEVGELIGQP